MQETISLEHMYLKSSNKQVEKAVAKVPDEHLMQWSFLLHGSETKAVSFFRQSWYSDVVKKGEVSAICVKRRI